MTCLGPPVLPNDMIDALTPPGPLMEKNTYALKTPHIVVSLTGMLLSRFPRRHSIVIPMETFLTLWLWPMTLTYKLDLDILPLDLHTECLSVWPWETHRDTHRRCQNYYTRHVTDGCKKASYSNSPFASSTSPHIWLADGDSLMCYIVRMSRLIA